MSRLLVSSGGARAGRGIPWLGLYNLMVCLLVLAPIFIVVLVSITSATSVEFPPSGFSLHWYRAILSYPEFLQSLGVSLAIALLTSTVASILGMLAALGLDRYRFPGHSLVSGFLLSPLMLPTIVLGIALLVFYTRIGITRTPAALVVGHIVLATPYVVRLILASLAGFDRQLEHAARNLGASAWQAFRRVKLPLILPGVSAGAVFAFLVSFDDVSVSIFLAGPQSMPISVRIFTYVEHSSDPMIAALNSVLIIAAAVLILVVERSIGLRRVFGVGESKESTNLSRRRPG